MDYDHDTQILRLGFLVIRDLPSPMVTLGRAGTDKLSSHEDKSTTRQGTETLCSAVIPSNLWSTPSLQYVCPFAAAALDLLPETAPAIKTKLVVRQNITGNGT